MNVIETNRNAKIDETKRNVIQIFLFEILNDYLLIWWFDNEIVVCNFHFSFQQNDVSTFKQRDEYCRNHLMNELIDSKNMKIVDWLNVENSKEKIDVDCHCNKFIDWLIFKTKKSTIESFRENSFCCFIHENSFCDFVIFSKNLNWTSSEQHSSSSKRKFIHFRKFTCWLIFKTKKSTVESFRWFENALCKFFIQFTKTSCFVIFRKRIFVSLTWRCFM